MEFFCYHRDRRGSMGLRRERVEQHWAYMDGFADQLIARGPTYLEDGTLTGSLHIVALPDPDGARAFAFDEPGYQLGVYRDVLLRRWDSELGGTMWDRLDLSAPDRFLVIGFEHRPADRPLVPPPTTSPLVIRGPLLSDDGQLYLGSAAIVECSDAAEARAAVAPDLVGVEVHKWRPGGRPAGETRT